MKNMKRIGCLLLVVAMCLALGVSAFADNVLGSDVVDATISISGATSNDQTFYAYQIFSGDVVYIQYDADGNVIPVEDTSSTAVSAEGTTLSNIEWGDAMDVYDSNQNDGLARKAVTVNDVTYSGASALTIYEALAKIQLSDRTYPFTDANGDPLTSAEEVAAVLSAITYDEDTDSQIFNAEITEKFGEVVSQFVDESKAIESKYVDSTTVDDKTTYNYTISITSPGYYLVENKNDSASTTDSVDEYTEYIIAIIGDGNYPVEVKEEPVQWDKTITGVTNADVTDDDDHVSDGDEITGVGANKESNVSIGDSIGYNLHAVIPDISEFDYYYFNVEDILSKGLTLDVDSSNAYPNADGTFTITVTRDYNATHDASLLASEYVSLSADGNTITFTLTGYEALECVYDGSTGEYVWQVKSDFSTTQENPYYFAWGTWTDPNTSETYIYIALNDFLQYDCYGCSITVDIDYSATLNEDAVIGVDGNENDSKLIYSNDPTHHESGGWTPLIPSPEVPTGTTPGSQTWTYTTGIQINKVDDEGNALTGAGFTLTGVGLNTTVSQGVEYVKHTASGSGSYWKLYDDATHATWTFTTESPYSLNSSSENYNEVLSLYEGYSADSGISSNFVTYDKQDYVTISDGATLATDDGGETYYYIATTTYYTEATRGGTYYKVYDDSSEGSSYSFTTVAPTADTMSLYEGYNSSIETVDGQSFTLYDASEPVTEKIYVTSEDYVEITVFVDDEGVAIFGGLGAGTYTISETTTPDGYNTIDDITFTIVWTEPSSVGGACTWTITNVKVNGVEVEDEDNPFYDSENEAYVDLNSAGLFEITIVNNAGIKLPGTGGIGTTIFYIVGACLVVGAVVVLVTRKRVNGEPEA